MGTERNEDVEEGSDSVKKKSAADIAVYKEILTLQKRCKELVPEIYACFCKAMIDEGYDVETIEKLFTKTQELWNDLVINDEIKGMIDWCEQTTGIELANRS